MWKKIGARGTEDARTDATRQALEKVDQILHEAGWDRPAETEEELHTPADMNDNTFPAIPPDIIADLEEAARQAAVGGVRDPELLRRIAERSARAREELRREYGERNIAVDLIRDSRDEE